MPTMEEYMVRYDNWCGKCKHKRTSENDDPCEECLNTPVNKTERPIKFEEK